MDRIEEAERRVALAREMKRAPIRWIVSGVKLPSRFVLVIEGKLARVSSRALLQSGQLAYLLNRLLTGSEADEGALRSFGLRVFVETDTDGGEERP